MTMIIDCHGHYTVLPKAHDDWRDAQKAAFKAGTECPPYPDISDDDIRETIEANQLRLLKERGADMTIFSPRASAMAPHVGDQIGGGKMGAGVQRSDRAGRRAVSGNFRRRLYAAAIARGRYDVFDCGA